MFKEDFRDAITRVLADAEVGALLKETTRSLSETELRRELESRREDVAFEVSRESQQVDVARRLYVAAQDQVDRRLRRRPPVIAALTSALLAGVSLLSGGILFFKRPDLVRPVLAAWPPRFLSLAPNTLTFWASTIAAVAAGSLVILVLALLWRSRTHAAVRARFEHAQGSDRALAGLRAVEGQYRLRLEEQVRKAVVEILNEARNGPNRAIKIFVATGIPTARRTIGLGLSEAPAQESITASAVQKTLIELIRELPSGNFGVSGPRGVGKSTLLALICESDLEISGRPALTINTAAPVEYDSRDFLLHLFSTLCRKALKRETGAADTDPEYLLRDQIETWRAAQLRRRSLPFAAALAVFGLCMGLAAIGVAQWSAQQVVATSSAASTGTKGAGTANADAKVSGGKAPVAVPPPQTAPMSDAIKAFQAQVGPMALFSLTSLIAALVISASAILARARRPHGPFPADTVMVGGSIAMRSRVELRNIRFQRSFTAGWSGSLKAPAAFELGASGSLAFAQQPETLPELVERFRQYVERLVSAYGRVVIGIDELDKLKSAKEAEIFLNSVKSVFNIPGCFFLVSVSEHALASFDRRGLGFRDAFDSALDQVVQIDYCDLDGSRALLKARILRWPEPFLHLSHMLSGGLPRDLIRSARRILQIAATFGEKGATLKAVADALVAEEARAKIRATSIAIRQIDENHDASDLLIRVARLSEFNSVAALAERVKNFRNDLSATATDSEKIGRNHLLCQELGVYLAMLVQVHRVSRLAQTRLGWQELVGADLPRRVTQVRQALEVSMPLATARLDDAEVHIDEAERKARAARAEERAVAGVTKKAKVVASATTLRKTPRATPAQS